MMRCKMCDNKSDQEVCPHCQDSINWEVRQQIEKLEELPAAESVKKLKDKLLKHGVLN